MGRRDARGGRSSRRRRLRRRHRVQTRRAAGRRARARLHEGAQLSRHRARRAPLSCRPGGQPRHPRDDLLARHGRALRRLRQLARPQRRARAHRISRRRRNRPGRPHERRVPARQRPQAHHHATARDEPMGLSRAPLPRRAVRGLLARTRTRATQLVRLRP